MKVFYCNKEGCIHAIASFITKQKTFYAPQGSSCTSEPYLYSLPLTVKMGNYFSAWHTMINRWIFYWDSVVVLSSENPALTWNYQMNKHDGAGLSWDVNRMSDLNQLEFCSMVGHDADVRVFLYPIIEERYAVIIDNFHRSEFDWDTYDEADFLLWNDQDMFDIWEIWRMCHDQAYSYAASRAEICNNFGLAGDQSDMGQLLELFSPTAQRELTKRYDFKYETIGFREFAMRIYSVMCGLTGDPKTRDFLKELLTDIKMRRQGVPYRYKAVLHML